MSSPNCHMSFDMCTCVMCHISHVTCHLTLLTCHLSPVNCHKHQQSPPQTLSLLISPLCNDGWFSTKNAPPNFFMNPVIAGGRKQGQTMDIATYRLNTKKK